MKIKTSTIVIGILLIAVILRIFPTAWDGGYYTHPDEAHIYNVVFQLQLPASFDEFLSAESGLNPHFFAYGSFPLYLLKGVAGFFGLFESSLSHYGNLYKIGRPLSALFDIGTLALLILLAKKLFDSKKLALIAGALYAFTVFAIQNTHFYIVDVQLTFWAIATLTAITYAYADRRYTYLLLSAITAGFGLATKFSGITLVPVVFLAAILLPFAGQDGSQSSLQKLRTCLLLGLSTVCIAIGIGIVLQPYALIDFQTFKENITLQLTMSRDATIFPYTIQYLRTLPYIYPLEQILTWGIGLTVGLAGLVGVLAMSVRAIRPIRSKHIVPLLFVMLFFWGTFLTVGMSAVKFMRYYLPLYPIIILGAALVLRQILRMKSKIAVYAILAIIIVPFGWWTLAFYSIYTQQHPWITASDWLHDTVPVGTHIAVEHWDRSLPIYGAQRFPSKTLELYIPDSETKIEHLIDSLTTTEYIVIASNRLYGSIPNIPANYPATILYYDLLFAEQFGFEKVAEFTTYPTLGIVRNDQHADESFTVYDHPKVSIFHKTNFDPIAMEQLLRNSLE